MKVLLTLNLLFLSLVFAAPISEQKHEDHHQLRECPLANCADPQFDPKTGCFGCEKSNCKYRGCVNSGANGPSWMPDNCTVCFCDEAGNEACTKMECPVKECFGFPTVRKPGRCCPECDFGEIPKTECKAVPVKRKSMYASLGDESCQRDVVTYGCDKEYITDEEGTWFGCDPVKVNVTVSFPDCRHHGIGHVMYEEVLQCKKRRLEMSEIPMDFDPSPPWECPLYIEPL